ncbi:MAG: hypothetical protein WD772_04120 [Pseudohongiellaceae bacterium]
MTNDRQWPFNVDLSSMDTGSITNILNDIEVHIPLMDCAADVSELLKVKALFEKELMVARRLH